MKSATKKIAKTLGSIVAAMAFASTASAAVYNMTVTNGTYQETDYQSDSSFSIDLAGRWVSITVSDTFEEMSIYYGGGYYETGLYKTALVSDVAHSKTLNHTTGKDLLYSADGIHFFTDFLGGMYGGSKSNATLTPTSWTYSGDTWGYYGSYSTDFVATVPVPAAAWLFGSSLLGLAAQRKFRAKA